jgi:hypothetical protein
MKARYGMAIIRPKHLESLARIIPSPACGERLSLHSKETDISDPRASVNALRVWLTSAWDCGATWGDSGSGRPGS